MKQSLPLVNAEEATYECIFGRGCDGICCQNGRPAVYPEEVERIDQNLHKFLPELRPEARAVVEEAGYLSRRRKLGEPMLRVQGGWCIFFNQGCVLHKVGAVEGDAYRYKPCLCALFPLAKGYDGRWYVRQHGYRNEEWDVFCLDPKSSQVPAVEALQDEIALAHRCDLETAQAEAAARKRVKSARSAVGAV